MVKPAAKRTAVAASNATAAFEAKTAEAALAGRLKSQGPDALPNLIAALDAIAAGGPVTLDALASALCEKGPLGSKSAQALADRSQGLGIGATSIATLLAATAVTAAIAVAGAGTAFTNLLCTPRSCSPAPGARAAACSSGNRARRRAGARRASPGGSAVR